MLNRLPPFVATVYFSLLLYFYVPFLRWTFCSLSPFYFPLPLNSLLFLMKASRALFVRFVEVMTTNVFKTTFSMLLLEVSFFGMGDQGRYSRRKQHLRNDEKTKQLLECFGKLEVCQDSRYGYERDRNRESVKDPARVIIRQIKRAQRPGSLTILLQTFGEGPCPVPLLKRGPYLQSILNSTARRMSNIWTTARPSTFDALVCLHSMSLITTRISTKIFSYFHMYVTGTLFG